MVTLVWNPDIEIVEGAQHKNFLQWAYRAAWESSHDTATKTGAVIVTDERIIGVGYNHFKPTVKVLVDANPALLEDKKWKASNITHAEDAAIEDAMRLGSLEGTVMYMPWVPCDPCAQLVIGAGIKAMYGHKDLIMKTPERWWTSCDAAIGRLRDNGVALYMLEGKLGGVKSLFNGEEWEP